MKEAWISNQRAWRFLHPELDAGEGPSGLQLTPRGGVALARGAACVRQSLLLLLSTVPGERVMRPEYGCDLFRVVFSPNDDTTAGLAIHYVRQAIARWEPRVKLLRVDAGRHPEVPGLLEIRVEYRLRATGERDAIALALDLSEGGTP